MINRYALRLPAILSLGAIIATTPILSGCSSDDAQVVLDLFAMDTSAGNGGQDDGSGGNGGSFNVTKNNGGRIEITNAGENTASFTPTNIATVSKNLGDNPLTITSSITLPTIDLGALPPANQRPPAGEPFTILNFGNEVYISDGAAVAVDGTLPPVTGIEVSEGAVLTLELNSGGTQALIVVANDFCNFGEVTTVDVNALLRGGLQISAATYIGTGAINTHGTLDAQSGGLLNVFATGAAYNSGNFTSRGSDTTAALTNAGNGGFIGLQATFAVENMGAFDSSGAAATDGAGGAGGPVSLTTATFGSGLGDVLNGGGLDTSGGAGTTAGGFGGNVNLSAGALGKFINNAAITTVGGGATPGSGGAAGTVTMTSATGDLRQNSTITATGGSGGATGNGGNGGSVNFFVNDAAFAEPFAFLPPGTVEQMPAGDLFLSGTISTKGGEALATGTGDGGNGGSVNITVNSAHNPEKKTDIFVRGYSGLDARGGDGNQGGNGGGVDVAIDHTVGVDSVAYAAGTIDYTNVDLDARGGNVVAGATNPLALRAGAGGSFELATPFIKGFNENENMTARSTADLALSGGTGTSKALFFGGNTAAGGNVNIWGYDTASSRGDVAVDGGDDADADGGLDGFGAFGGSFQILSELGNSSSDGNLSLNGGDGELGGGFGGDVTIVGRGGASSNGDITTNGGNADAALANSTGGDGGDIDLITRLDANPTQTGATSFTGGTGERPGTDGSLRLNEICTGDGCSF